jgi:hypothetical protein
MYIVWWDSLVDYVEILRGNDRGFCSSGYIISALKAILNYYLLESRLTMASPYTIFFTNRCGDRNNFSFFREVPDIEIINPITGNPQEYTDDDPAKPVIRSNVLESISLPDQNWASPWQINVSPINLGCKLLLSIV